MKVALLDAGESPVATCISLMLFPLVYSLFTFIRYEPADIIPSFLPVQDYVRRVIGLEIDSLKLYHSKNIWLQNALQNAEILQGILHSGTEP